MLLTVETAYWVQQQQKVTVVIVYGDGDVERISCAGTSFGC